MVKRFAGAILVVLAVIAVATAVTSAGTDEFAGMTLTTPDTYHACPAGWTHDSISLTGVGTRQLQGWVHVQYILDGGRSSVQFITINQTGDLNLTIDYPPASEWPPLASGTREVHVDLAIGVYEDGELIYTFGPGTDWDVFCLYGPPPPPGGQGCTPGYWRQSQHFDSWVPTGYSPSMYFDDVFGVGPHITLLQAVWLRAGDANALARHAVAALLDASSPGVSYGFSVAQVIALVQDAYNNITTYEAAKDLLEAENERGCPLH